MAARLYPSKDTIEKAKNQERIIVQVPIGKLNPAPYNPRSIKQQELDRLERSIKDFGFVDPIIANAYPGRENVIIGGHARLAVAKRLNMKTVPTTYTYHPEPMEKALNIALNNPGLAGKSDDEKVGILLQQIKSAGIDPTATGYTASQVENLLTKVAGSRVDRRESHKPDNPITKPGDLWILEGHRLLCGDATKTKDVERLMDGDTAQIVFTDPPYGVAYTGTRNFGGPIKGDIPKEDRGFIDFLAVAFKQMSDHTTDNAAFYIWHSTSTREQFLEGMRIAALIERQYLIWAKDNITGLGQSDYRADYEPCFYAHKEAADKPKWTAGRDQATVWRVAERLTPEGEDSGGRLAISLGDGVIITTNSGDVLYLGRDKPTRKRVRRFKLEAGEELEIIGNEGAGNLWTVHRGNTSKYEHPTTKPPGLGVRALRNSSTRGDIVLDLFAGSGSTMEAAHELGRVAYMMEKDPAWCDTIVNRADRLGIETHKA